MYSKPFIYFLDVLMFALTADENTFKQTNETSGSVSKKKKSHKKKSKMMDGADSNLHKVLSKKEGTSTSSRKKRSRKSGVPKKPLVCTPCNKRFDRRSKLDIHNRRVHNVEVRYRCDGCHQSYSRQDYIPRHIREGHCPGTAGWSSSHSELSTNAGDELSMLIMLMS